VGLSSSGAGGESDHRNNGIETRNTQLLLSAEKPFTQVSHWAATLAYTYTNASQNRDINEHYAFDEVSIAQYPFILSNAASKHRVVARAPSGLRGVCDSGQAHPCHSDPQERHQLLQQRDRYPAGRGVYTDCVYRARARLPQLRYAGDKNFNIQDISTLYLRVDLLNVFNVKNYIDYLNAFAPNGLITGGKYDPHGNISGIRASCA